MSILYEDANKERRNLMLLSFGMITYYLSDGQLKDQSLSLPIVNVVFQYEALLGILVWCVLFWFAFRYWIESKRRIKIEFFEDLHGTSYCPKAVIKHFRQRLDIKASRMISGFNFYHQIDEPLADQPELRRASHGLLFCFTVITVDQPENKTGDKREARVELKKDFKLVILLAVRLFFTKPSLSANLAPFGMVFLVLLCSATRNLPFYPAILF